MAPRKYLIVQEPVPVTDVCCHLQTHNDNINTLVNHTSLDAVTSRRYHTMNLFCFSYAEINECLQDANICDGTCRDDRCTPFCTNTPGGYLCSCESYPACVGGAAEANVIEAGGSTAAAADATCKNYAHLLLCKLSDMQGIDLSTKKDLED